MSIENEETTRDVSEITSITRWVISIVKDVEDDGVDLDEE